MLLIAFGIHVGLPSPIGGHWRHFPVLVVKYDTSNKLSSLKSVPNLYLLVYMYTCRSA